MPIITPRMRQTCKKIKEAFQGWRGAIKLLSIMTWLLAIANLVVSIKMTSLNTEGSLTASVSIMSGPCDDVNRVKFWTQLAISAAATALLAATNFAIQAWTALTRDEIDRVHRCGETVDIGIPSLRNMTRIAPWRRVLWAIMFVFATTINLLYSNAFYGTSWASDYVVSVLTSEEFSRSFVFDTLGGVHVTANSSRLLQRKGHRRWENISIPLLLQRYGSGFVDQYRSVILVEADGDSGNAKSHVMVNATTVSEPEGVLYEGVMQIWSTIPQDRWLCDLFGPTELDFYHQPDNCYLVDGDVDGCYSETEPPPNAPCRVASIPDTARAEWMVDLGQLTVQSQSGQKRRAVVELEPWALSEEIEPECRLLSCPLFWWLATASNAAVAGILAGMAFFYRKRSDTPLVTIGDVMNSYLCIPSADLFGSSSGGGNGNGGTHHDFHAFKNMYYQPGLVSEPREFRLPVKKRRLVDSVDGMRWWATLAWWLAALMAVAAGFSAAWRREKDIADNSMATIFVRGFNLPLGRITMVLPQPPYTGPNSPTARRLQLIVLANLPQQAMVVSYLLYNSLLTIMVVELEWQSFGGRGAGRPLRVSQPRGSQLNTFFLSLPYAYAIPLLVLSGVLQWLVGQSLFFAEVDLFDENGQRLGAPLVERGVMLTLGYSLLGLFWVLMVGMLAWLLVLVLGYFKRPPNTGGMPLLGSCSAVVAASCRFPPGGLVSGSDDYEGRAAAAAGGNLRWGVVIMSAGEGAGGSVDGSVGGGVFELRRSLGFSSGNVETPVEGEIYR